MKLTIKQLKQMIRECLAAPMEPEGGVIELPGETAELSFEPEVEVASEPEIRAGLFPGMSGGPVLGDERSSPSDTEIDIPAVDNIVDLATNIKQQLTESHATKAIAEELKAVKAMLDSVAKRLAKRG